jgi:hypothetical protein
MRARSLYSILDAYDTDEIVVDRAQTNRKQYSRGRSARAPRRRSSRSAGASVPLGISARRNRHFSW